jgi:hypothetical protein
MIDTLCKTSTQRNIIEHAWDPSCSLSNGSRIYNHFNISGISLRSVLLVEDTGVPWQTSHLQTLSARCELTTLVMVIGTDCTGSCKSNNYMITTMMVPSRDKNKKIETQNKYIITSKSLSIWSSVVSSSKYLVIVLFLNPLSLGNSSTSSSSWSWSCSWSYGSWIYNYLCNQCLSPLKLRVQILFIARCTRYNKSCWIDPVKIFLLETQIYN